MPWLIIITELRGVPSFIIPISQVRKQTERRRRHEPQSTQFNWKLTQDLNLGLGVPSLDLFQVSHSPSSQGGLVTLVFTVSHPKLGPCPQDAGVQSPAQPLGQARCLVSSQTALELTPSRTLIS